VLDGSSSERSMEQRAKRLNLWLRLADRSWNCGNDAAYFAIYQAVYSPALLRLDELWSRISSESIEMMTAWQTRIRSSSSAIEGLPFHQPAMRKDDCDGAQALVPYLGLTLPAVTVGSPEIMLSRWIPLASAFAQRDLDASMLPVTADLPSGFSMSTSLPGIDHRPLTYWMELSCDIQPSTINTSIERGWSRAEGRNMTALRPLLFTTPLPINTMFVGNGSPLSIASNRTRHGAPAPVSCIR
jgi:hypothetical protein